jgi:hypothetical protein
MRLRTASLVPILALGLSCCLSVVPMARADGPPPGYSQAVVKATFEEVLTNFQQVPPDPGPIKTVTTPPAPAADITPINPFLHRSKDSFSRSVRVWPLRDDYEQWTDRDEDDFESLADPTGKKPPSPLTNALVAILPSLAPDDPHLVRLRFDCAATFPLREFGTCGEVYEQDGAIIHEGMRIVANERGDYLVRFNISTPAMPVSLRLQLRMNVPGTGRKIWLTLPPIEVKPDGSSPEFYKPAAYGVSVVGHSAAMAEHFQKIRKISPAQCEDREILSRAGTARFGVADLSSPGSY